MPLLDIRNLTIEIETAQGMVKAVDRFSMTLSEGEIRGLVGESGSGKSLVAKSILGIDKENWRITADRLRLGNTDLLSLSAKQRRQLMGREIGMIFQDPASCLDPSAVVGDQLAEAMPTASFRGPFWRRFRWREQQAVNLLHKVGVKDHRSVMKAYPHELSDGVCQKVMIAMAIANNPKLLVADEPITLLESTTQWQILKLLEKLNKLQNTSILLISHDLETIRGLADNITVMYCGQVVEAGTWQQVLETPHHPYTEALLRASPKFNEGLPRKSKLQTLPGSIPLLQHLPAGCRLGPRCPRAQRQCVIAPQLSKVKGHQFACHFPVNMEEENKHDPAA